MTSCLQSACQSEPQFNVCRLLIGQVQELLNVSELPDSQNIGLLIYRSLPLNFWLSTSRSRITVGTLSTPMWTEKFPSAAKSCSLSSRADPANAARTVLELPSLRVPPGRLPVKVGSFAFAAAS